jgi:hypothetical protein
MAEHEWYWCLDHNAAEPSGSACPAESRMGPYASREAAEHWRERVANRNDAWDREDREWTGDDES